MDIKDIVRKINGGSHRDFFLKDYPKMTEIEFRELMKGYSIIINRSKRRERTHGGFITKPTYTIKERKHIMLSVKALADRGYIGYQNPYTFEIS